MRADARSLLDRLGRSEFAYKEFADRFSDLELWPLFEALLKDPRLFLQDMPANAAADKAPAPTLRAPQAAAAAVTPSTAPTRPTPPVFPERAPMPSGSESLAELFNRYEGGDEPAPAPAPASAPRQPDVRAMLRRLSDLGDRGEL